MSVLKITNAPELVASKVGRFLERLTPDDLDSSTVEDQVIKKMIESLAAEGLKGEIAAVNGLAVGGGMDLALACDFRTAGQSARFAETYAKIGLAPGGGGAYFLPRLVGMGRALELLWTAEFIDADTAKEIGLVNHVFPNEMLMEETLKIAQRIASMPPLSIRLIKRAAYQSASTDMETALDLISSHIAVARAGADHPEAIAAFKEKRAGSYVGY